MATKNVIKQLRREMTKSPKKAGALGLLVLVAAYFWAPLVWGWVAKDTARPGVAPSGTAAAASSSSRPVAETATGSTATKPPAPTIPWQQLTAWIDDDPRTAAVNPVLTERDPFGKPKVEAPPTPPAKEEPEVVKPQEELTPQSLGLVLSSTIIGSRHRVARISGKTYEEGQTCQWSKDGQKASFTLAEVYPRRVVLTRQGASYELTIAGPAKPNANRMELIRNHKVQDSGSGVRDDGAKSSAEP